MTDDEVRALLADCSRVSRNYTQWIPGRLVAKMHEALLESRLEVATARREVAEERHNWTLEMCTKADQDAVWSEVLAADEAVAAAVAALYAFRSMR